MKKFNFRPEVILKLREQREQLARRKLADAQGTVVQIQSKLRDLHGQLEQQTTMVRAGVLLGAVDVQYMSHYRRHAMALHRLMIQNAQSLQQANVELQRVRGETLQAVKERKVMTKLKENLLAKYRQNAEHEESRELDEMTSMRFGHQQYMGQAEQVMGRKVFTFASVLCMVVALAALGLAGWLAGSGRLGSENRAALAKLFRGESLKPEAPTTQPATTQPAAAATEQVVLNESATELANLMLDRRVKELSYQETALQALQRKIAQQREELRLAKVNFLKEYEDTRQLQQSDGFKNQLKLYETMQPKLVKDILMGMEESLAAQYLTAMNKRTASKIVSEFRTPDEKTRLQRLLERMRSEG